MNKHQKILNTISEIRNSHTQMVNIYSYGSCMNFFCILRAIFPDAKPYYNSSHVITKIGNKYYDITGQVRKEGHLPFYNYYNKRRTSRAFTQMYNAEYYISYGLERHPLELVS